MKLKEKKSAYLFSICVRGNNLKYTRKQELSFYGISKAFLKEKGGGGGGGGGAFTPESESE